MPMNHSLISTKASSTPKRVANNWYVIAVTRGHEEAMASLLSRVVPHEVLSECFFPQYATEDKYRGRWVSSVKPLFPGYLIAVTDDPEALMVALGRVQEYGRVLSMGELPVPLAAEEVELIGGLSERGHRVVPMSHAVKEGERVVIVDGPLLGREGLISSINRHRSTAYLEIDLCGTKVRARVGLAVLSNGNDVATRVARIRSKAAC